MILTRETTRKESVKSKTEIEVEMEMKEKEKVDEGGAM